MHSFVGLIANAAAFILVPWIVWRLLRRSVPFAVLPIMIGLGLAVFGGAPAEWGIPSASAPPIPSDIPPKWTAGPRQIAKDIEGPAIRFLLVFAFDGPRQLGRMGRRW